MGELSQKWPFWDAQSARVPNLLQDLAKRWSEELRRSEGGQWVRRYMGVSTDGGSPQMDPNGWLKWNIPENTTKMDDLAVPLFQETSIYIFLYYIYMYR